MNANKLTKQEFYAMIHTVQISVPIDKEKELLIPNAPYVNTHYEVRNRIKSIKKILTDLPKYTDEMNENMTNALYERYLIETNDNKDGRITSFTEFVTRYYFMFFNTKILYSLYKKCLTGKASSWFYKFTKSGHILKLYSKREMQAYINELKKALELFYKS